MRIVDNHLKAEILLFHGKTEITPTPTSPALIADMKISDMGLEKMTTETVRFTVPETENAGNRSHGPAFLISIWRYFAMNRRESSFSSEERLYGYSVSLGMAFRTCYSKMAERERIQIPDDTNGLSRTF